MSSHASEFLNQYTGQRFASSTISHSQLLCLCDIRFMTCECFIHPRLRYSFSLLHMWFHHQMLAQVLSKLHPATPPGTSTSVAGFAKNIPCCGFGAFNIGRSQPFSTDQVFHAIVSISIKPMDQCRLAVDKPRLFFWDLRTEPLNT